MECKSGRFSSSFARNPLFDGMKFKYKEMENMKYIISGSDDLTHPCISAAKSLQLCPTLCDPIDSSPPGSPVPGILQARTLEWVALSFSNAWKWKVKVKSLSRVRPSVNPWTAAYQASPSMGFSLLSFLKMREGPIIQSDVSQKEKDKYRILMHIYGI